MKEISEDSENTEAKVESSDDEDLGRSQEEINLDHVSAASDSAKQHKQKPILTKAEVDKIQKDNKKQDSIKLDMRSKVGVREALEF